MLSQRNQTQMTIWNSRQKCNDSRLAVAYAHNQLQNPQGNAKHQWNFLCLGGGHMTVFSCQIPWTVFLENEHFVVCKLHLNNDKKIINSGNV